MAGNPTLQTHLCNATPPWSALLVVPRGTSASALVKTPPGFAVRTIQGKKCRTPSGLFGEFARALAFPDYFGHNWDALEECLADLEWLPAKGYILLITDTQAVLPEDEEEYETLLEILERRRRSLEQGTNGRRSARPIPCVFCSDRAGQIEAETLGAEGIRLDRVEDTQDETQPETFSQAV